MVGRLSIEQNKRAVISPDPSKKRINNAEFAVRTRLPGQAANVSGAVTECRYGESPFLLLTLYP